MEVSDVLRKSLPLSIQWVGEKFGFGYSPAGYNEPLHIALNEVEKLKENDPERLRLTDDIVSSMVIDWELTRDKAPIPVSPDEVAALPYLFKQALVGAIMVDMRSRKMVASDPKLDASVSDSSSQEEDEDESQGGTALSVNLEQWEQLGQTSSTDPTPEAVTSGAGGGT